MAPLHEQSRQQRWRARITVQKAAKMAAVHHLLTTRTEASLAIIRHMTSQRPATLMQSSESGLPAPVQGHDVCADTNTTPRPSRATSPLLLRRSGGTLQWSPELATGTIVSATGTCVDGLEGQMRDHPAHKKVHQRSGEWPKVITEANMTAIGHRTYLMEAVQSDSPSRQALHDEHGKHMATVVALPFSVLARDGGITTESVSSELLRVGGIASSHEGATSYAQLAGSEAGQYMECGWGITPGSSRKATVQTNDGTSFVPFFTADSDVAEKNGLHASLQVAVARAADSLAVHYPDLLDTLNSPTNTWPELAEALCYPRPLPGHHRMYGNKVAVRSTGVRLGASKQDIRRMHCTNCDLHSDPVDASRMFGSVLMYAWLHADVAALSVNERQPHTDLLVFTSNKGGRCWRIQTAVPDCVILVFTHSDRLLHCNPYPDTLRLPIAEHAGWVHLRMVLYALTKIDNLIKRLGANKKENCIALYRKADTMLKSRLDALALARL